MVPVIIAVKLGRVSVSLSAHPFLGVILNTLQNFLYTTDSGSGESGNLSASPPPPQ